MPNSAGFTANAPQLRMVGRAVQQQKQVQRMSQQQIMSLKLLAMGSLDLREAIYSKVAENPALEITRDAMADGVAAAKEGASPFSDNTRYGAASAGGEAASDAFQAALESAADSTETLQEHLLHQYNAMPHTADEAELGSALIHNLDAAGFHLLAPLSLLNKSRPAQNEALLQHCMAQIRALDPVGTCCANVEESLLVQAQLQPNAPKAALFLLDGHLALLNPPQAEKVLKKIRSFLEEQQKLAFIDEKERAWLEQSRLTPFTLQDIATAISFIRTLDPYPARNFGSSSASFIAPDVYVEKIPATEADEKHGIVSAPTSTHSFKITLASATLPTLAVSKQFEALAAPAPDNSGAFSNSNSNNAANATKSARSFARDAVRDAKVFIESLQYRESTVARATAEIVRAQLAFFENGARYLAPLRQKDIAAKLGVHEATISRMASSKYLQCEWGLFELGYFFTNAVGAEAQTQRSATSDATANAPAAPATSKEAIKYEVAALLQAHSADKKPLSDQKLTDLLAQKGIKIARRTVAKYRAELNINSSYSR